MGCPRKWSMWGPVVAYMVFIFVLSSLEQPPQPPGGIGDKAGHALLYSGLGALLVRAFAGGWRRRVSARTMMLAVVVATAYGASDELHQRLVPPRQMDALDLVADAAGASLAAVGCYFTSRFRL